VTPDAARWRRLEQLYTGAAERTAEERAAFLAAACPDDEALRTEVAGLLAAGLGERALEIERWVHDSDGRAPGDEPLHDPLVGTRVGPWRIVELAGRGGMGRVYRAERADGQFEQHVALKVAEAGMVAGLGAEALDAERRTLARLSHPNVARLLDAGLMPGGRAYLVMEYVDGAPIVEDCDRRRLSIDERLRVFRVVCDAVQHAHASLVVHRDLKPSNIFVTRAGEVKLLDFGIARLVEQEGLPRQATAPGRRALTPAYAAPEQLLGGAVTTATDVYGLGAVLYELLTGRTPFQDGPPDDPEALPSWLTSEPVMPSVAVRPAQGRADAESMARAEARGTSPARLARRLAGDIDRVVLKALSRDPRRRYASAGQFAEEISRLLAGQPVIAQPDKIGYRFKRFVLRHRVGVAFGATALLIIMAVAAIAGLQARALATERDRVRLEADRARRVVSLVAGLFGLAESAPGAGETITARELLDRGAERIDRDLAADPATQEALYEVVGRAYANLGLHAAAVPIFERVLDLRRRGGRGETLDAAATLHDLAGQQLRLNDYAAAERHYRQALQLWQSGDAAPADLAATLEGLGRVLSTTGRHDAAAAPLREALALRRQAPSSPAALMSALHELGLALHRAGEMAEAERLLREAVTIGRRLPNDTPDKVNGVLHLARFLHQFNRDIAGAGPLYREALETARRVHAGDHQDVATCLSEFARHQQDSGRLDAAERLMREALGMFERLYGGRHREVIIARQRLAGILAARGANVEAEQLQADALAVSRDLMGEAHPLTLAAQRTLADRLEARGALDEARRLREAELATASRALGDRDVYVAIALTGLGHHAMKAGRPAEAEAHFRRALAIREHLHPPGHWRIEVARVALGGCLLRLGRFVEAESLLVPAYERVREARGAGAGETRTAIEHVVALYEAWGQPEKAGRYRVPRETPPAVAAR